MSKLSRNTERRAKPPKLAIFLPSLAGGGVERVFVQLANRLHRRGCAVDMVLASACGPYLCELDAAVKVVNLERASVSRSFPRLASYLRSVKPDAMLSGLDHANIVLIAAKLVSRVSTRCVISSRSIPSVWYRESRTLRTRLVARMMRLTYPRADATIVNSSAGAADLERFAGLNRASMFVIPNPVDMAAIDSLSKVDEAHNWCASGPSPLVLGVGRLDPLKDFSTLVRAFARVRRRRECRLVILGEGPEHLSLQMLANELGVRDDLCMPGFVANPFPWMRNASVLVSSSLSEGCPNAVMQALACGTRVVSTDSIGGAAEVLEDGKWGHLVPVGDSLSMANAVVASLDSEDVIDGRKRARDFSPDKIVEQYLHVLLPTAEVQVSN